MLVGVHEDAVGAEGGEGQAGGPAHAPALVAPQRDAATPCPAVRLQQASTVRGREEGGGGRRSVGRGGEVSFGFVVVVVLLLVVL
eukprot:3236772-Rhodomonas_salina.1